MDSGIKILNLDFDLKKIVNCWEIDKTSLNDESRFKFFRPDQYQDYIIIKPGHPLYDIINLPVDYVSLTYLRSLPRAGLGPVHIDSNRGCALNIPIQVDFDNSFCFVANEECTERDPYEFEPVSPGSKRYLYEPEKYQYYNVRKPCLLNTKKPHGFANFADTERVLLSISFTESFNSIMSNI